MLNYDEFYDLSHNEVLSVLNSQLTEYLQKSEAQYNKLLASKRSTSTRMKCRDIALKINVLTTIADGLELDTSDETIFKATDEYYDLPSDYMLHILRKIYSEYKNKLDNIESQLAYHPNDLVLNNKYKETDNLLYTLRDILETLYIDVDSDDDDDPSILSDDYGDDYTDYGETAIEPGYEIW